MVIKAGFTEEVTCDLDLEGQPRVVKIGTNGLMVTTQGRDSDRTPQVKATASGGKSRCLSLPAILSLSDESWARVAYN